MSATSSFSGFNYPSGPVDDSDENKQWTDLFVSSLPSTGTLSFSAATGSLNSWGIVKGHGGQFQATPQPEQSPYSPDFDALPTFPASNNGDGTSFDAMGTQGGGQMWPGSLLDDQSYTFSGNMQLGDGDDFDPSFGDPDIGENESSLCLPCNC